MTTAKMLPAGWDLAPVIDYAPQSLTPVLTGWPSPLGSTPFGGYSKAFEAWFREMQRWEGGRSNHPADRGGATNRGVIWTTYQRLAQRLEMPGTWDHFWNRFTEDDAKAFAFEFARGVRAEEFDAPAVGYMIADMNWGGGAFQVKYAQRAIAQASGQPLTIDGVIGEMTVRAANSVNNGKALLDLVTQYRRQAMQDIISNNASQRVFEKGWENRIAGVYRALAPFAAKKKAAGRGMSSAGRQSWASESWRWPDSAPQPMPEESLPYPSVYDGWEYEPEPVRQRSVRFALAESFKDKGGRFSGREMSAFVLIAALLTLASVSLIMPVPEFVFVTLATLAGTLFVGYSIEGFRGAGHGRH